jgi:hypothetical protein
MSAYAIASIPAVDVHDHQTARLAWERGDREDDNLAAWQRYGFFHPDLPEVIAAESLATSQDVHTKVLSIPRRRAGATIGGYVATWGHFPRALSAFAILLALSIPALAQAPCKVNVNSATPAQLALLIQTGPALAAKIEAARTTAPLTSESLDAVPGVGVKWLEYNTPHVAYDGPTTCTDKLRKPSTVKPETVKDGSR